MVGLRSVGQWVARSGKRIAVTVVGVALVVAGVVGLVAPVAPGFVLIIAGLAVLGTEYTWARRTLVEARRRATRARDRMRRREPRPEATTQPGEDP